MRYRLEGVEGDDREVAQRVHDAHHGKCPLYRTLHECIEIGTELELG